jgi:hypothetical protein
VLFSGRIAYPFVMVSTWARCPFIIERIRRVDENTLRIVGRKARGDCDTQSSRHVAIRRPTSVYAVRGERVARVIVLCHEPEYRIRARVRDVLA